MARFNTQLVHGEPVNDNDTRAVNPPIYNSSTFAFESVDAMPRWDYARSGNPTREYLERQIAQLEHGTRGFAFASGLAAIHPCCPFSSLAIASLPETMSTVVRIRS